MIALIQRVLRAEVRVLDGEPGERREPGAQDAQNTQRERVTGAIGAGLLAFVCAERGDTDALAGRLLTKLLGYRVFGDATGKMNLSVQNIDGKGTAGGLLLVPQFTLAADTGSGLRPSFTPAAPPDEGRRLFGHFVALARTRHPLVQSGEFGAHMQVALINDGPVTFWLQVRG